jgi:hypothetical protein
MKKFISQAIIYVILFTLTLFIGLEVTSYIVKNRDFKNHETESNLLIMNSDENYDLLFLGISHARNFSRHKNHLRIEKILDKRIINIGQGDAACGINEQLFYLEYFYQNNNKTKDLIFVFSPPLLFSETLPIASNTFLREPFNLDFFTSYLVFQTENKYQRLQYYLRSKLQPSWLMHYPYSLESEKNCLSKIDSIKVQQGQEYAYKGGVNMERFEKSCDATKKIIELAIRNNTNVIILIPPAVFGKWKGHEEIVEFGLALKKEYNDSLMFYDFSEAVLEPSYYYDHHHLNTIGVEYFTKNMMKKIVK